MRVLARVRILTAALVAVAPLYPSAADSLLQRGDRVAVVGDSITQQAKYSRFIEAYLMACTPQLELQVMQLGWSGETAAGFVRRMERDLVLWRPDVATLCYGMNDGGWRSYADWIGKEYDGAMRAIVGRLVGLDCTVIVGAPGVVDTDTFRWQPDEVNDKLARLGTFGEQVATDFRMPFADVHRQMMDAMIAAKAEYGPAYHVAGSDGVHPAQNGHLIMACAFLRAMELDGHIGTFSLDWKGTSAASPGHELLTWKDGRARIRSERYPFCFEGEPADPAGTLGMTPFIPFNEELNRFMLVVTNLPVQEVDVQWGRLTQRVTAAELGEGINLAALFPENPFSRPFRNVQAAVLRKQTFETYWVHGKYRLTHFRPLQGGRPKSEDNRLERWRRMEEIQEEHRQRVRAAVEPVVHTLVISPVE